MRETRRAETNLRDLETIAHFQQTTFVRNFQTVENDFAVPAVLFRPHDGNATLDTPPRLRSIEEKSSETFTLVVRSTGNKNEVLCAFSAGDKPLATGDDPFITLLFCLGVSQRRIGAAAFRFSHGKSRAHFAIDDGLQPAPLEFFRLQDFFQQDHIAVIGWRGIENHRTERRTCRLFIASCHTDHAYALTST